MKKSDIMIEIEKLMLQGVYDRKFIKDQFKIKNETTLKYMRNARKRILKSVNLIDYNLWFKNLIVKCDYMEKQYWDVYNSIRGKSQSIKSIPKLKMLYSILDKIDHIHAYVRVLIDLTQDFPMEDLDTFQYQSEEKHNE
jgi:hypothetical protein